MNLAHLLENPLTYEQYSALCHQIDLGKSERCAEYESKNLLPYAQRASQAMWQVEQNTTLNKKLFNLLTQINYLGIVCIAEPWCMDAAQILPVLHAMEYACEDGIFLDIFLRDQNPELMSHFLTNGSASIPVVVFTDGDDNVLAQWGARSQNAAQKAKELKEKILPLNETVLEMQRWYEQDKTQSFQEEMYFLLKSIV